MSDDLNSLDRPAVRYGYAQIGDVRLHYAECGAGEHLVVLLHGFPECWYSWRHQLAKLGERFHVVAPDMRGYNLSDKPAHLADYRIEKLCDDVLGLIRHFGAHQASIVGHDWGAAVAWALAERYPDYVSKLCAMQVPPMRMWIRNMSVRQALRSWYMLFFQLPRVPEWWISTRNFAALERSLKTTSRRGTFSDADISFYKTAFKQRDAETGTTALTAAINYYRANFNLLGDNFASLFSHKRAEHEQVRARVHVPTLFIYGERDFAIVPQTVRGVGAYVDATYREVRLAQSNHWVNQEYPNEVNAALFSFLTDVM